MLSHGRVLHTDIFSYTHAGQPWVAHEWLSEVLMALAYRAGGWGGVLVLFALVTALTAGLLAQKLSRWLNPLSLALVLALAFWVASPSLLTRPHVLALPIFVTWMGELLDARAKPMLDYLAMFERIANRFPGLETEIQGIYRETEPDADRNAMHSFHHRSPCLLSNSSEGGR